MELLQDLRDAVREYGRDKRRDEGSGADDDDAGHLLPAGEVERVGKVVWSVPGHNLGVLSSATHVFVLLHGSKGVSFQVFTLADCGVAAALGACYLFPWSRGVCLVGRMHHIGHGLSPMGRAR